VLSEGGSQHGYRSTSDSPAELDHRCAARRWRPGHIDRINLSVAAPQLQKEFNLSPEELGLLFSASFRSYSPLQVPGGLVLDRFGVMKGSVQRMGDHAAAADHSFWFAWC
jgi:hypothetical protein